MKIAEKEGAYAVAHGATGKGNDQVRFELTYAALNPKLEIIAPWKDPKWTFHSREDAIDYAAAHKIPLNGISKKKIYSEDGNLLTKVAFWNSRNRNTSTNSSSTPTRMKRPRTRLTT